MDRSLTPEIAQFAAEVREWLAAHMPKDVDGPGEKRNTGRWSHRAPPAPTSGDPDELAAFVERGRSWQRELAEAGWVGINWPAEYGGRAAGPLETAVFNSEYARSGAPQLINRVGLNLVAPTLLAHGSPEQCRRWLPKIATAEEIWCQLFSEPGAGSDLASASTRAEPVFERRCLGPYPGSGPRAWRVSGTKVWTSYAQFATYGLCLARTGNARYDLSLLVVDMRSPGVKVRPLVQITGDAEFNAVFLDAVEVPADHVIGEVGRGWEVAATTLAHERGISFPLKEEVVHEGYLSALLEEAVSNGSLERPEVSDRLVDAFVALSVLRVHNWRTLAKVARGQGLGAESSWVKLTWSQMTQQLSEVALDVQGQQAAGWGPWQRQWLWSKAASIAGGTSEIQRDIIGEKILGLPRAARAPRA